MHDAVTPIVDSLTIGTALFERALEGLDPEEGRRQPSADVNPMLWVAGHVASSRFSMLAAAGADVRPPWGQRFARGSERGEVASLPDAPELLVAWHDVTERLVARLAQLTEVELHAPSGRTVPLPDLSVRGVLTFLAWHEGWHLGQMAYLRKWLGRANLVG